MPPLQLAVILPVGSVPVVMLRLDDVHLLRMVLRAVQAGGDGHDIARRQEIRLARSLLAQLESAERVM